MTTNARTVAHAFFHSRSTLPVKYARTEKHVPPSRLYQIMYIMCNPNFTFTLISHYWYAH